VLEEGKIQCRSNGEVLALRKNNMTAIVTLLNGLQDIGRVIFAVAKRMENTCLGSSRRRRARLLGVERVHVMVWSFRCNYICAPIIDWCRQYGRCLKQGKGEELGDTHVCRRLKADVYS
jgi:hypothetical protein